MSSQKRQKSGGEGSNGSNGNTSPGPVKKKLFMEPCGAIGAVSTLEEMDIHVLRFQHKKLKQNMELRQKQENDLRLRIEQLEKRQTQDDAVVNVINRYWNQLDEDVRILLQRFDGESEDMSENKFVKDTSASFGACDKEELEENLANRVQVSVRAVAKLIQAFDRLQRRNKLILSILGGEHNGTA